LGVIDGKRVRKNFPTEPEAREFASQKRLERERYGTAALSFPEHRKAEAQRALEILRDRATLDEAAAFWLREKDAVHSDLSVSDLVEQYLAAKRASNRRGKTVSTIAYRLHRFSRIYGDHAVSAIEPAMVDEWLNAHEWAAQSRKGFRAELHALFEYACRRKLLRDNPINAVDIPLVDDRVPLILMPDDCERLLSATADIEPRLVPYIAISLFAGTRASETRQLQWCDVHINERYIRVRPQVAKKRRQRLVDISDNLAAWLDAYPGTGQHIFWSTVYFRRSRKKAGVVWEGSIMRHTYASMHIAEHENAAATALQMGHRDPGVMFEHYRELVRRDDARQFWSIWPAKKKLQKSWLNG
jgi:integrase